MACYDCLLKIKHTHALPIMPTPLTDASTVAETLTALETDVPGVLAYALDHSASDALRASCACHAGRRVSGGGMRGAWGTYAHRRPGGLLA